MGQSLETRRQWGDTADPGPPSSGGADADAMMRQAETQYVGARGDPAGGGRNGVSLALSRGSLPEGGDDMSVLQGQVSTFQPSVPSSQDPSTPPAVAEASTAISHPQASGQEVDGWTDGQTEQVLKRAAAPGIRKRKDTDVEFTLPRSHWPGLGTTGAPCSRIVLGCPRRKGISVGG